MPLRHPVPENTSKTIDLTASEREREGAREETLYCTQNVRCVIVLVVVWTAKGICRTSYFKLAKLNQISLHRRGAASNRNRDICRLSTFTRMDEMNHKSRTKADDGKWCDYSFGAICNGNLCAANGPVACMQKWPIFLLVLLREFSAHCRLNLRPVSRTHGKWTSPINKFRYCRCCAFICPHPH